VSGKRGGAQAKPREAARNPVRGVIADNDSTPGAPVVENLHCRSLIGGEKKVALRHHVNVPSTCKAAIPSYTAQIFIQQQHRQSERDHELMNNKTANGNGVV
jgi:hypothetical protein